MDNQKNPFVSFGSGSFHSTSLYTTLCQQRHWSAPVALAIAGGSVLAAALMLRIILYLLIRATGQSQYTPGWQSFETFLMIAMFLAGAVLGFYVFGNILSAGLCGICFGFLSMGVALQALTANERDN